MEPRPDLRDATIDQKRVIASTMTSKHRVFQFRPTSEVIDQGAVIVAVANANVLAVLSSRGHVCFSLSAGGYLGVGNDNRYNNNSVFDPFPFPALTDTQRQHLTDLGERLDVFRKDRLAAHDHLTMTGLYNALERLRELEAGIGEPMSEPERDTYDAGQIRILAELHDAIDRAVLDAYGWSDLAPALVGRVGGTLPSPHKGADQEAAEEELLTRLVALNEERVAEEARGDIRWLRPDYQVPKLGKKAPQPAMDVATQAAAAIPDTEKPKWPSDSIDQIRLLRRTLADAPAPMSPADLSARFKGGRKREDRIGTLLRDMVELGVARASEDGRTRFFVPE